MCPPNETPTHKAFFMIVRLPENKYSGSNVSRRVTSC